MTLTNLPKNKKVILLKKPENKITDDLFKVINGDCIEPNNDELLIKVDTIGIDAWIRTTFYDNSYHNTSKLNQAIGALGVGQVLISKSDKFKEGDFISGPMGTQTHTTMHSAACQKVETNNANPELNIGLLGLTTGLTAYFGLLHVGKVQKNDLVVISGAAGGVGVIACQLAKIKGAKVIGIAGSEEKRNFLLNKLKVDFAINYKNKCFKEELESIAKDKIDIFFDNVGGEILNNVLHNLNTRARIVICGAISQYNNFDKVLGPSAYLKLAERYSRMEGFTVMHFSEKFPQAIKELTKLYNNNELVVPTHYEKGIEAFPKAIQMLFNGSHKGKLMVKI
ncbi:MAG: NADP-dependent oxidoreductase [Zetaproteobacteria bacterium]|nr:NADP-dependent oxidoreductase [Pseudobdellovibrionaceae bacterium]